MKKLILALLVMMMLLGCGGKSGGAKQMVCKKDNDNQSMIIEYSGKKITAVIVKATIDTEPGEADSMLEYLKQSYSAYEEMENYNINFTMNSDKTVIDMEVRINIPDGDYSSLGMFGLSGVGGALEAVRKTLEEAGYSCK